MKFPHHDKTFRQPTHVVKPRCPPKEKYIPENLLHFWELHFKKPWAIVMHYKPENAWVFNSELNWIVFSFNVFLCRDADNCHSPRKQLILSAMVWLPLGDRTNRCRFDSRCSAEDLAWVWADLACAKAVNTPTHSWTRKSSREERWRHTENYYSKNWVSLCFFLIILDKWCKILWKVNH